MVKKLPAVWETQVQSLVREDLLEKGMVTYSGILAWRIPWTEEPGRLQSMGSQIQTWLSDWHFHFFSGLWICVPSSLLLIPITAPVQRALVVLQNHLLQNQHSDLKQQISASCPVSVCLKTSLNVAATTDSNWRKCFKGSWMQMCSSVWVGIFRSSKVFNIQNASSLKLMRKWRSQQLSLSASPPSSKAKGISLEIRWIFPWSVSIARVAGYIAAFFFFSCT